MDTLESLVIGAGQAGLSSAYHLKRRGIEHLVLDANPAPGGAWQHRWDTLTMRDVHGIADLPDEPVPRVAASQRANRFVPDYFADYERRHALPIVRPVRIERVEDVDGLLHVHAGDRTWSTRTLVNATGTWDRPFWPHYPGRETFLGDQLHAADYTGPSALAGRRVLIVGGGASAVQLLGEIRPVAETLWVTRRPPVWHDEGSDPNWGRWIVGQIAERVREGRPPGTVSGDGGIRLRPQEAEAARLGAFERHPMFAAIEPHGVRWADGSFEAVDVIVWATGFRPAVAHLGPLGLRSERGGIRITGPTSTPVTAADDPRVQLVGYGPSASTIGANRAGRLAAIAVARWLAEHAPVAA